MCASLRKWDMGVCLSSRVCLGMHVISVCVCARVCVWAYMSSECMCVGVGARVWGSLSTHCSPVISEMLLGRDNAEVAQGIPLAPILTSLIQSGYSSPWGFAGLGSDLEGIGVAGKGLGLG